MSIWFQDLLHGIFSPNFSLAFHLGNALGKENTRAIIQESWNPWTYSRNGHRIIIVSEEGAGRMCSGKGMEMEKEAERSRSFPRLIRLHVPFPYIPFSYLALFFLCFLSFNSCAMRFLWRARMKRESD